MTAVAKEFAKQASVIVTLGSQEMLVMCPTVLTTATAKDLASMARACANMATLVLTAHTRNVALALSNAAVMENA